MKNLIFFTLSVLFFTNCKSEKTISKNNLKSVWEINYIKSKVELDSTDNNIIRDIYNDIATNKFSSIIVKENEHLLASYDDQHLLASYDEILFDNFPFTSISTTLEKKTEKNYKIKNRKDFVENDEPSLFVYILRGVLLFSILGFGLFFLIRAWWRGWKDNIRWVKILTYIVSILVALWIIIGAAVYFIFRNYGFG
tara:strand:+ start:1253 stop:1840 length:588 start_codon:yes stop_codon:yes gene_type:complete